MKWPTGTFQWATWSLENFTARKREDLFFALHSILGENMDIWKRDELFFAL